MTKKKTDHDDSADLRKRAEEALRESEERYKELWERAPVAYHVLDPDGKIAKVNQTEASILGYRVHEMVGKSIFDFILPEQRDEAQKRFRQKIQGLSVARIENRIYLKKDGSRIYVVIDDVLEWDAHKKVTGIRSTLTDVTDRKGIEEELRKSEKKYRSLVETAGSGIAATDQRGVFIFVNETLCRMCGYPEQEMIGMHFADFLHPDDRKNVMQIFEDAFINPIGNPYIEFRIIHKDGHIVYMCSNPTAFKYEGQLLGFNAIITDITERKRAEEALRESEERYRRLVETAPEVIYNLSAEDGTITLLNPAFERITGWSRAEWLGKPFMPLVHPDDLALAMETFQHVLRGEPIPPYELRILSKSGEYLIGEFTSFPYIEKRKVIGEFGIVRDITERKRAEKEIQNLAKFPSENPNPVLRIARDGLLLYVNEAGVRQLADLHLQVGQATPPMLREVVFQVMENGSVQVLDLEHRERAYSFFVAPVVDAGYANLYGLDITERKRAEEAVRKSEEKYRGLTENINLGIYRNTVGPEGKFIEANPANIKMFGYNSKEEFLAINVSDLYQNSEYRNEFNDKMLKEGFVRGEELWLKKKDGSRFVGSVSAVAVKDEQGHVNYYDGIIEDITERKRVEDALRFTRLSLDNAVDAMVCVGHDARYFDVNDAFCRSVGYSREELLSKTVHDIDPDYSAEVWPEFWKKLKQSGSLTFESCHYTKAGKVIPVEITAKFFEHNGKEYHCGFARDITERKRTEEALQVNLEKYRVLFESFPLGITISDKSGKIIEANRQSEQLLGITADVHVQRRVDSKEWQIIRKDGTPMPADEYASTRALRENRLIENVEMGIVKDKGEITWISVTAAPIPLEGYGVAIAYGDITERKRAEEEIRKSNAELKAFVDMLSHDLKNPVVSIQGFCSLLIKNHIKDLNEKALFCIQRMQANASLMTDLLEDLAELSRIGRIEDKKTEISVQEVIKSVWAGASASLATQNVEFVSPENLPQLFYSEKRLYQIFYNLLSNALKFRDEERTTKIEIGHQEDKDNYTFFVRDSGIGIEQKFHSKIFESFSQLKDIKSEGTGMGLAIVKKIVETNKGKVWVESQKGAGSTFYFTIPKNLKS